MRVIAGKYRSRPLRSLRGMDLRPTADRLRETLFNILTAGNPDALQGTVWIDLFAGTGAVGIEALSRSASQVHFVESSAPAVALIRANLESLGEKNTFQILKSDALQAVRKLSNENQVADFIFLDPPYRMEDQYKKVLAQITEAKILSSDGIVIAEHNKRFDPEESVGKLQKYRTLTQGDAALSFYKLTQK